MVGQAKSCGCGCGSGLLERPRYFSRQLVTPDDLNLQQDYFRQKLRRHNLMLHGWGVVCGADVCRVCKPKDQRKAENGPEFEDWMVKIKSGYLIGPCGDDIWIQGELNYDIRSCGFLAAPGEPAEQSADPWCSDVHGETLSGPVYVAVRYREITTRPVRAQPTGCGCDESQCEYSRWRDCYQVCTLRECPASQTDAPSFNPFAGLNPACPSTCCDDPWVVLAEVTLKADGSGIDSIDPCKCRRMVASFGHLWWSCQDKQVQDANPADREGLDRLDRYSLMDLEGIDEARRDQLMHAGVGIEAVRDFLTPARTQEEREELATKSGLGIALFDKFTSHADLIRVHGIGPEYAELLERTGVHSVQQLADEDNAEALVDAMQKVKAATGRRVIRNVPRKEVAAAWIQAAKKLKPMIQIGAAQPRTRDTKPGG